MLWIVTATGESNTRVSNSAPSASNRVCLTWATEFRSFVEHTEKELGRLFKKLDVNRNGELDRAELRTAFKNAGLTVSTSKFEQFFSEIDTNHDGSITFDEWRFVARVEPWFIC